MIDILSEMFSLTFLVRAFIVGFLVSICAALLGVSLVLKRYSMIGHGLADVGFGSLALATALNLAPLAVSIPAVVAAAFLLLRLSDNNNQGKHRIKGDAAIALISTASLAIGVIIISQSTGMNTDVCNYLFGSILAMFRADVYFSVALSIIVMVLFILFYNKLFAITFDEDFAKSSGVKTGFYNMLIALLTAFTIVLGMRIMGALLISSLIIFPALSSMRLFKKFKSVTICAALISVFCFFTGVVISYVYDTPVGASVVAVNILIFILFWSIERFRAVQKKKPALIFASIILLLLNGCTTSRENNEIIEIKEVMFVTHVNEIYINAEDYLGRKFKFEGILMSGTDDPEAEPYYYVARYGPGGCCGIDGIVGFEIAWAEDRKMPYPELSSWVEVTGELKIFEMDYLEYLYIDLISLNVLEERGAEFVSR